MYLGSYGVASTYCLADSIDRGRRCYQESSHLNSYLQKRKAIETMVEAAVWQGLASVIIPGFTINRICAASRFTLKRCARRMPPHAQMWVTTLVGLSAIPVIIKPIDRWVALNNWMKSLILIIGIKKVWIERSNFSFDWDHLCCLQHKSVELS